MRFSVRIFVLGFVVVFLATVPGFTQQKSASTDTSLGDIARKLRAQKANERQPVRVITNDNIGGEEKNDASAASPSTPTKSPGDAGAQGAGTSAPAHDAEYYRRQQRKLQDQLDTHKRELAVLQQKLGQNQMQFYSDPYKSLTQQYTRKDVNQLTADIDAKKQQMADDEKALDNLRDQLRHEGGDPGWLR